MLDKWRNICARSRRRKYFILCGDIDWFNNIEYTICMGDAWSAQDKEERNLS